MRHLLALLCVCAISACATHSPQTLATIRSTGIAGSTMVKLERGKVLLPTDLVEMNRRGISDAVALRHLDKVGVDYIVTRDDMKRLRTARVSPVVMDALLDESDRFVRDRYYSSALYYEPYPYGYGGWWYPRYTLGVGYGWPSPIYRGHVGWRGHYRHR